MSGLFLSQVSQEDLEYDGFFDGQNKIVPEGFEASAIVTGGFNGIEEGKAIQSCYINFVLTTPGEFYGQKYRYNAKVYDMDASKRDLAMKNLSVLDAQAGFPLSHGRLELTTDNIDECWAGKAHMRVKFGLMISEKPGEEGREINFVRGFGYLREKMLPPAGQQSSQEVAQQAQQTAQAQRQYQGTPVDSDQDIGF
jgi:hypothetical protein